MPVPIDRDHLQQLITEDDAQVIEVLPRAEYNWAHLTGAVHLWLRDTGTGKRDQRTRQIRRRTHPPGAHLE